MGSMRTDEDHSSTVTVPNLESSLAELQRTLSDQQRQEARLERSFRMWQQKLLSRREEIARRLDRIHASLAEHEEAVEMPQLSLYAVSEGDGAG